MFNYAVDRGRTALWPAAVGFKLAVDLVGSLARTTLLISQSSDPALRQVDAVGLWGNTSTTKVILSALAPEDAAPIDLVGVALGAVQCFICLGSLIVNTGQGFSTSVRDVALGLWQRMYTWVTVTRYPKYIDIYLETNQH